LRPRRGHALPAAAGFVGDGTDRRVSKPPRSDDPSGLLEHNHGAPCEQRSTATVRFASFRLSFRV